MKIGNLLVLCQYFFIKSKQQPNMIKINLNTLEGELDIEIKKNDDHYNLIVILSKSDYFQENGKAWHKKIENNQTIIKIADLIKACYTAPSIPKGITINDGISRKISLEDEDTAPIHLVLQNSYHTNTNESELIKSIFDYVCEQIQDPILENYVQVFDHYK